jgi:mono/diheme cytochrome c family protein
MKKLLKIFLLLLALIVLVIAVLLTFVKTQLPNVGEAPDLKFEHTKERIARGKYLAHSVMLCMDCHSKRDWSKFAGPMVDSTLGQGGEVFNQELGFPGKFISSNITPYFLKDWTDGEIFRAITSGVAKDGRALFPVMPHPNYGKMDEEDILSVIAYIRSIQPIDNKTETSVADFPMNFIINTIPQPASLQKRPDTTDLVKYGEYLVNAASCADCHTRQEKGQKVGAPFAGNMEFILPGNVISRSANITPHTSGIGNWTEEQFVARFKAYADSSYVPHTLAAGEKQTVMPWAMYGTMTTTDLKAIFAYLKTVQPVDEKVVVFEVKK